MQHPQPLNRGRKVLPSHSPSRCKDMGRTERKSRRKEKVVRSSRTSDEEWQLVENDGSSPSPGRTTRVALDESSPSGITTEGSESVGIVIVPFQELVGQTGVAPTSNWGFQRVTNQTDKPFSSYPKTNGPALSQSSPGCGMTIDHRHAAETLSPIDDNSTVLMLPGNSGVATMYQYGHPISEFSSYPLQPRGYLADPSGMETYHAGHGNCIRPSVSDPTFQNNNRAHGPVAQTTGGQVAAPGYGQVAGPENDVDRRSSPGDGSNWIENHPHPNMGPVATTSGLNDRFRNHSNHDETVTPSVVSDTWTFVQATLSTMPPHHIFE
jgi:hypothetical protein